jgi:hypothetical protein
LNRLPGLTPQRHTLLRAMGPPPRVSSRGRIGRPDRKRSFGATVGIRSWGAIRWSGVQGIYNSAVVRFGDGYAGVFRTEDFTRFPRLHVGWSENATDWTIEPEPISFTNHEYDAADYAYDPRVVRIEGWYYVSWCGGHNGPTISLARTKTSRPLSGWRTPSCRSIATACSSHGRSTASYLMLSRPSDDGHTPFGDIYLSQSPDMVHWGAHRLVMRTRRRSDRPMVATNQNRGRAHTDRNARRLADDLSRRDGHLQRLRLQHGRRAARPRRALEVSSTGPTSTCSRPTPTTRSRATCPTLSSRAPRCTTKPPGGWRFTTAPPTPARASPTRT